MKQSLTFLFLLTFLSIQAQERPTVEEFLGYSIGDHFTYHHQVVDYFKAVADASDGVVFQQYGSSWERRPLVVNIISSPENIQNLETIRRNNLIRAGMIEGEPSGKEAAIVWLMYNIHGDEASATESALWTLQELTSGDPEVTEWLEDVVVVIDPCENPDGKDRYTNWFNEVGSNPANPHIQTAEHGPPWPGGRSNHYLFDLNRDWAWQTQTESQNRAKIYHQWMPHVHIDLHEMGHNDPYFFAPAARPFHDAITPWQEEFQEHIGKNNSKYFDENGWIYYTREIFDLLYPSYGDTWPTYQGAIGLTYERGGSRNAGTHVITERGDTLTLRERAQQHMIASMSTVETAHEHKDRLLDEFKSYFDKAQNNPEGSYKSYVIKGSNGRAKLSAFAEILNKQGIDFTYASGKSVSASGFDYQSGREGPFKVEQYDLVISSFQPQSNILRVLMEPETALEDSLTYDLTAWALPYVYDLEAYACKDRLKVEAGDSENFQNNAPEKQKVYAILSNWESAQDVKFLAQLFKAGIKMRHARKSFKHEGKEYERGTLVITAGDNRASGQAFVKAVTDIANELEIDLHYTQSGYTESGIDLGSDNVPFLKAPKVAIFRGSGVNPYAFGEVWHYFEQVIEYPLYVLDLARAGRADLDQYDVIILASGSYGSISDALLEYGRNGGHIVALERAISTFSSGNTSLSEAIKEAQKEQKDQKPKPEDLLARYEDSERSGLKYFSAGSIYRVSLDNSHPLAYGQDEQTFIMKRSSSVYPYMKNGWNVGALKPNSLVSGFIGSGLKKNLEHSIAFGVERLGGGQVVYFADSPIFRGFWESGKLFLGNAIFLVGQ